MAFVNLAEDPLYGKLVVIVDVVDQNRVRHCTFMTAGKRHESSALCGPRQNCRVNIVVIKLIALLAGRRGPSLQRILFRV